MPLVAVVANKDGQGGTTYACALAGFLAHHGHGGHLLDGDPQQGDAIDWAHMVKHHARLLRHDMANSERVAVLKNASTDPKWQVLDVPPQEAVMLRLALSLSSAVLMPTVISGAECISSINSFIDHLTDLRVSHNLALKLGLVANNVRTSGDKSYLDLLASKHNPKSGLWFLGQVGHRTAVAEACIGGYHIWDEDNVAGIEMRTVLERFASQVLSLKLNSKLKKNRSMHN